MRIVFMGTPDFAVASLRALSAAGHEIAAVVTKPDMPKNRGMKLMPSPVKKAALELGLPVYTPEKIRSAETAVLLASFDADVFAVVAFGRCTVRSFRSTGAPRPCSGRCSAAKRPPA